MDWTVGTFGTLGNDALDSWDRRRPGGIHPGTAAVPALFGPERPDYVV